MAEIDPVVLELRAEVGKYRADLKSTTSLVSQSLGQQEKSVQRLEAQMRRSSGAIGGQIKGLAAAFAGAFTGRELVGLIDGFTRLQNSLRVAGLEGQNLERVQSQLLDLSSKYGVGIEGLADLFGKTSQTANELGASQQQLIQLTEASSQALKITGTSAQQAQGALLGLTQALASGKVRAEEFNQINEGGLRPLLQVIANTERFGGSVAKLRQAVNDGKVSSQEFFQAILGGAQELDAKASKATLTLAGAVEALTSRLTVYVGSASSAQGVTGALAGAISALADNLDVVIPALAVLATALGVGFVTNAIAARVAALSAAAATGTLAASATFAGRALLAAFGGPIGIAITALAVGLAYVASNTRDTSEAARQAELQSKRTEAALNAETTATNALSKAKGREREAMLASLAASRARAQQALQTAQALRAEAAAALAIAKAEQTKQRGLLDTARMAPSLGATEGGARILYGTTPSDKGVSKAQAELDRADANIAALSGAIEGIGKAIDAAGKPIKLPTIGDGKKPGRGGGASNAQDRAAQAEARAAQDLNNLQIEELRARAQLVTNAEDRADFERQILGKERDAREADIAAAVKSGDLTAKQAAAQREILDKLYGKRDAENVEGDILVQATKSLYGIQIERERRMQAERDRADLAETEFRAQSDALRNQYDLATTLDERRAIALQILDAEDAYLRSKLEAVIANDDLTKAVQDQAKVELAALNASAGDRRKLVLQSNQGPLDRYIESTRDTKTRVEEAMVREIQSVNDGITDALTKQLGIKNQFVKDLLSIFLEDTLFRPIAEALRNRGGGGGGLLGSLLQFGGSVLGKADPVFRGGGLPIGNGGADIKSLSKIFGRASGGYVAPGQTVRVNEHAGGVELLRMGAQGGTVIPLGAMNQRAAQPAGPGGGVTTVRLELSGDIDARIQQQSLGVAVEVYRAGAPGMINAAADETMRRAGRPKI